MTEIIGAERMAIETFSNLTGDIAKTYISGNVEQSEDTKQLKKRIQAAERQVDSVLDSLYNKRYTLINGEQYTLSFRAAFETQLYITMEEISKKWGDAKQLSAYLIDPESMGNLWQYQEQFASFTKISPDLLVHSDDLVILCLTEAAEKRELSLQFQVGSVIFSLLTFIFLIYYIIKHLYAPLKEIKEGFEKMGNGVLTYRFNRRTKDEFYELYRGFNVFLDNLSLILKLEDHILQKDNLDESKDPETGNHLHRMTLYSQEIARKLANHPDFSSVINEEFIEKLQFAAPMHDIGKVSIKDAILLKPGKLTEEEFTMMKLHTVSGGKILDALDQQFREYNIDYFRMAAEIAWQHQEKYNGSGYPNAISEEEISVAARICAVEDVFDALSSRRPYKDPFSIEKCFSILEESRGTHFDARIVDAFLDIKEVVIDIHKQFQD